MALVAALGTVLVVVLAHGFEPASRAVASTPAASPVGADRRPTLPAIAPARTRRALQRLISLGEPVRCGGGRQPVVALTFDDGPGPFTARTLNILRRHGARATFFLVARLLEDRPAFAGLPLTERTRHAVGTHTFDHVSLLGATQEELGHQIGDSQEAIAGASGGRVRLFRPPYGARDDSVDTSVRDHGMLQVLWNVDSLDSRGATAAEVLANVAAGLRPGAIVLLHENRGTTLHVLPEILDLIALRGYRAVTVPELLAIDPPTPAQLRSGSCP